MKTKRLLVWTTLIVLLLVPLTLIGCESTPESAREGWQAAIDTNRQIVDDLSMTADDLIDVISTTQSQVAVLPEGETRDQLLEGLARAQTELQRVTNKKAVIDAAIERAQTKLDQIPDDASASEINIVMAGEAVAGVGGALPAPFNIYAGVLGTALGGIGTLIQSIRRRREENKAQLANETAKHEAEQSRNLAEAARSIVNSLEAAKTDPEFKEVWNTKAVPIVNAAQTTAAKAVVSHVRGSSKTIRPEDLGVVGASSSGVVPNMGQMFA